MNKIWNALLIIGICVSIFTGSFNNLGTVIINSATDAFSIFFKMALLLCFWNGIFNVAIKSGLIKNVTALLKKPLKWLFPEVDANSLCMEYICSNVVANMLGLGAAATPLGLKAFALLQEANPHPEKPTRSMITFVLLNISTLTFFPTTIISLRVLAKGTTNFSLILSMILLTFFATCFTIILDRLIYFFQRKKK